MSKILPLLLSDFNVSDSCLIPVIDVFSDIINDCSIYNNSMNEGYFDLLRTKCYIFTYLCELVLPSPLIDSQIHSCQHLYKSIMDSGSMIYCSTWRSERYYGVLKRNTFGRLNFNESTIIHVINKEIELTSDVYLQLELPSKPITPCNGQIVSTINMSTNNTPDSLQYCDITFPYKYNSVYIIKGLRGMEEMIFTDNNIKNLLKFFINEDFLDICTILYSNNDIQENMLNDLRNNIDNPSVFKSLKKNFLKLQKYFYSEILINNDIIFSTSKPDEGVERIDNSYIMYYTYNNDHTEYKINFIKALAYMQINREFIVCGHKYPSVEPSKTGLYYCIIDSEKTNNQNIDNIVFIKVIDITPTNLIVANIVIGSEEDETYKEKSRTSKKKKKININTFDGETITNTVFMQRDIIRPNLSK
ncbi:hypothetical protein WA158_003389 [Blastocystis sp. Blastoise]